MSAEFDVIIVGSGPAGVSAALPLVDAGLKVLLIDGGQTSQMRPPTRPYLVGRYQDARQWEWMIGRDYQALQPAATSPKLRVPGHAYVFDGFSAANRIDARGFVAVGSLARGGLSNVWGCGVARLLAEELEPFPFAPAEIEHSYAAVTRRIGVSGAVKDDLTEYFGLDAWADPPIPIDPLQQRLLKRHDQYRTSSRQPSDFRLGRSRVAALSQDREARSACDRSGNCLWGCHRHALYSATMDLERLTRRPNVSYQAGFLVEAVAAGDAPPCVQGRDASGYRSISAKKIILAAGTLATTRLALQALHFDKPVALQHCPTAAFMLWLPAALGSRQAPAFGLGQLSFTMSLRDSLPAFGSLFSTTGLPVTEFLRHLPFRKRYGIDLLSALLSSCMVGNLFLPGTLSTTTVSLQRDGALRIDGQYREEVAALLRLAKQRLRKAFWQRGAMLLPGSFATGEPGSDIHYACTLPMKSQPALGETSSLGEVSGLKGVHIVDGACLPALSEKSHTLTIMANADRIGRRLATSLANECK